MKKIKVLPIIALVIAIVGAVAFKPVTNVEGKATHALYNWYLLNAGGNKNSAGDYTLQGSEPTCNPGSKVCAVHAQDDGSGHPLGIPMSGAVTTNQFIDQVDHRNTN